MIQYLEWDSNFFEKRVGSLLLEDANQFSYNELNQFDLVYIIANEGIEYNFLIDNSSFLLVDNKITYSKKLIAEPPYDSNVATFLKEDVITKQLQNIAIQSGVYSRFNIDPNISEDQFHQLYSIWLTNSVSRKIAKEVLVYKKESDIAGLITLGIKNNKADIGIIAVEEKYRGNKIGTKLLEAAGFWAQQNFNLEEIQVVTQQANLQACLFYERNGFLISKKQEIYHWWKK